MAVPHRHQVEQLFQIPLPHSNAAVRGGVADRRGRIRSMNPVTRGAQSHPARAQRIVASRRHGPLRAKPGGVRNSIDYREFSLRRGRRRLAHGDVVYLQDPPVFNQREFAVGNRDNDAPPFRARLIRHRAILPQPLHRGGDQDRRQPCDLFVCEFHAWKIAVRRPRLNSLIMQTLSGVRGVSRWTRYVSVDTPSKWIPHLM